MHFSICLALNIVSEVWQRKKNLFPSLRQAASVATDCTCFKLSHDCCEHVWTPLDGSRVLGWKTKAPRLLPGSTGWRLRQSEYFQGPAGGAALRVV